MALPNMHNWDAGQSRLHADPALADGRAGKSSIHVDVRSALAAAEDDPVVPSCPHTKKPLPNRLRKSVVKQGPHSACWHIQKTIDFG
jgi:hypothetical protein